MAGTLRSAFVPSVQLMNADLTARVARDKDATAGGQFVYLVARRIEQNLEYRIKVRFAPDGAVFLQATRLINGKEELLGSEKTVPGLVSGAGNFIRVHARVTGSNPTTIAIRAWADASPEPVDWPATATDASPALQTAGSVGVRAYLAARNTNAPVIVAVDAFAAQ